MGMSPIAERISRAGQNAHPECGVVTNWPPVFICEFFSRFRSLKLPVPSYELKSSHCPSGGKPARSLNVPRMKYVFPVRRELSRQVVCLWPTIAVRRLPVGKYRVREAARRSVCRGRDRRHRDGRETKPLPLVALTPHNIYNALGRVRPPNGPWVGPCRAVGGLF